MSKAALVIDMPENCYECVLCDTDDVCLAVSSFTGVDVLVEKPDWCPLVPVPEKALKPFTPPWLEEKALGTVGEYAARFAECHGISITEAMKHPTVKAYAQATVAGIVKGR